MAWIVLAFFSGILLDIVDATYVCYAIDKDTQTITKPEVHEIYSKVGFRVIGYSLRRLLPLAFPKQILLVV